MRVPSPDPQGEGHERCVDLGMQHQRPVGVMGAERSHSPARNRRDPSRHRNPRNTPVMAVCWVDMALVMIMKVLEATCSSRRTMPDVIITHVHLSLIHISEPTRRTPISYA